MNSPFDVAFLFPTAIYSTLLGIVVVYWLVGMLGLIDLDFSGDTDVDADVDSDVSIGALTGVLLTFGLTGVPFTIVISIIILISWLISFYLQLYLLTSLPDGWLYYLAGIISNIVVLFVSLPITGFVIRPLKGMFTSVKTIESSNLVGKEAIIATSKVSETFGQAKLLNDGAEILVNVRCDKEHTLKMGDNVIVIEYSKDNHTYIVAPYTY